MINTIIFSKNRPAQLDLLLRSLKQYAVPTHINILYATDDEYLDGYNKVFSLHPDNNWVEEANFRPDLLDLLDGKLGAVQTKFTQFFCDDDVMVCPPQLDLPQIERLWKLDPLVLSLRLGKNTWCQTPGNDADRCVFPNLVNYEGFNVWDYRTVKYGNFGIPMSVDGSIFKTDVINELSHQIDFKGPNTYEAHLYGLMPNKRPYMACLNKSSVVGIPLNLVNTEFSNPHGLMFSQTAEQMNRAFLDGKRLNCPPTVTSGAHQYIDLFWSEE